ncbi:hypothetical protein ACFQ9O_19995, partial [Peribacillus simplex]
RLPDRPRKASAWRGNQHSILTNPSKKHSVHFFNPISLPAGFLKNIPADWNGRRETPAGKVCPGENPQAQSDEEAPGPPAESECLERKSTFYINKPFKKTFSSFLQSN